MFTAAVDIANRGLDHCGAAAINVALGFTEQSRNATICGRVYDKLRRAELRRNTWAFATKRAIVRAIDADTMLLRPAMWVSTTTYFVGSIVSDENNVAWISVTPSNLGNQPQNSTTWQQYFGPLTVALYDSTKSYSTGELVYTTDGDGTYRVYLSREDSNDDDPEAATAWDSAVTYYKDHVVTYSATPYQSRIDFNLGQTPNATNAAADWVSTTNYASGDKVTGSDGVRYTSLVAGNTAIDPVTDSGTNWQSSGVLTPWRTTFTAGAGSAKWLQIGGAEFPMGVALATMNIVYPLGSRQSSQATTRNLFKLPAGYLRMCSQDQKAGATSYLGADAALPYKDWLIENGYIVTAESGPLLLRFIADTVDVTTFDDMFCEGLAARIGFEVCETLTQSGDKKRLIAAEYEKFMTEARMVNAIETGSEVPPLDDWIACRA